MAQEVADKRDQEFVLHEMLNVASFSEYEEFEDFDKKTVNMILKEARNLVTKEIVPTRALGDVDNGHPEGCIHENGAVKVPKSYHKPYELFCEGEWLAMSDDPKWGGQGMPHCVSIAPSEMFSGGNIAFMMYPGLTHGAAKIVETFGTQEQKDTYLKKLFSGEWGGTMCLTEPEAGTDVGNLSTTAKDNGDGTYTITGNKIFISGGDSDMVSNILHPVLARIEGAPAGTKGISLFAVPKYKINEDGTPGESNDVTITGIEEKMGLHGNCTCSIAFGSKGNCVGTLLGEENKGMKAMFVMMNEARFGVGLQGYALGSASYMNAVNYAKQRVQGVNLMDMFNENPKPVTIINHPDVRRQLLFMKAYVDGMRSFLYYSSRLFDLEHLAETKEEKDKYKGILEIVIPILKSYCTDKGHEVCTQGIQVFGGYGFIKEYPQEQLLRDCKITSIYEGTNGVQAMDLLGRKLGMKKGKPFMDLLGEMNVAIADAKATEGMNEMAETVEKAVNKLGEVAMHMGMTAMSEKVMDAFGSATPFCEVCGDVVMAWMHLWRATVATKAMSGKVKKKDMAFYQGQVITARYYMEQLLPNAMGKMDSVKNTSTTIMEMPLDAFIG